jgi:prophage DNA circulation protein
MSWLDNLRPASFRGVPFYVETTKKTLGRRVVVHEFPNRETPFTQDMGRVAHAWSLDGHVLGTDYDLAKAKLEEAFNKFGPGELVHPYDGLQMVQVGAVEFSESTREGAILYFSATIYEAGSLEFPKSINDKASVLGGAAETALSKAKAVFDKAFTIAQLPGFAVESARSKIASAQKAFSSTTKGVANISNAAAQLAYSTRSLVAETNDLLKSPSQLSQRLLDSFALLQTTISNVRIQTDALTSFFEFGADDTSDRSTPVRAQETNNKEAFNNFVRRVAVVNAAVTAQQAEYETFQDAEEMRDKITAVIEEQIRATDDPELYQALIDVQAALVSALPDEDADLPNLKEVTTDDVTTSLHLAYDLFEDPRKESDIINRNKIKNPGFIPQGKVLEVLDGNV